MADEALEKVESGILAERPDFIPKSTEGLETLTKDDIQMPRMSLAQGLSPQLIDGDPKFIEGLGVGQLFNNVSGQIYGKGPLYFMVVRRDKPRGMEFKPREEGGGIVDFDVPIDDPRMKWGPDGESPQATLFYDFIIMVPQFDNELIALSFKGTGIKVAKRLNTLMAGRKQSPVWGGVYKLTTTMDKNDKGTFAVFVVDNAGWPTPEMGEEARGHFDMLKDKVIDVVGREPGEDDDPTFNTEEM